MTKILVIEDDIVVKDNIIDILREESFQAIDAANGLLGLKLAQEYLPDLILCDLRIPDINGYEVLSALKSNHTTSWIPFIFLTSITNRLAWRKGMELGADDYLTKPFTPQELLKAIAIRRSLNVARHKFSKIFVNTTEYEEILNFDRDLNLASRLKLQDKFEELVKDSLLEIVDSSKSSKIKLNIPVICLKVDNFNRLSEFISEFRLKTLLKHLAESLTIAILDTGIVTYLERGTFVIILPSLARRKDVISIVEKIQQILGSTLDPQRNCVFRDRSYSSIASKIDLGISFYPDCGTNLPAVIEQAMNTVSSVRYCSNGQNYALCQPKRKYRKYKNSLGCSAIKKELKNALALREFRVHYQPQIELKTNKIYGSEAALTWQHPIHGTVAPQKFIPVAEESQIIPLSLWLLEQACQQLNTWQQNGFQRLKLTLRVFQTHFEQNTFNLDIVKVVQKYQLSYDSIQLLLSEKTLLPNRQRTLNKLYGLSNLGVKLILDDFATGYTNLDYWRKFPLDGIRLNWQRLQTIYDRDRSIKIVEAATALACDRRIDTQICGIETEADWQFITQQKCDLVSGSYFYQPSDAKEFGWYLARYSEQR